jgi:hypothetical protein
MEQDRASTPAVRAPSLPVAYISDIANPIGERLKKHWDIQVKISFKMDSVQ